MADLRPRDIMEYESHGCMLSHKLIVISKIIYEPGD